MIDSKEAIQRHLDGYSRMVGHGVGRYEYIMSGDDLAKAFQQSHDDLAYSLKKETARQRYLLYNAKGLQEEIQKICNNAIAQARQVMVKDVANDIVDEVTRELNNITQLANGTIVHKSSGSSRGSGKTFEMFGKALANGLVKGVSKLIDEMTDPRERR